MLAHSGRPLGTGARLVDIDFDDFPACILPGTEVAAPHFFMRPVGLEAPDDLAVVQLDLRACHLSVKQLCRYLDRGDVVALVSAVSEGFDLVLLSVSAPHDAYAISNTYAHGHGSSPERGGERGGRRQGRLSVLAR